MGAFAPSPLDRRRARSARDARDRRAGDRRHGGGGPSVPRLPVRRPDADRRRPEGHRVQRAARRSRGAGDPAADRRAACCRCSSRRRRARCAVVVPARRATSCVGVVLASRGYPESSESGQPIDGIDDAERVPGVTVFHAGTARARRRARHRRRPGADRRRPRRRASTTRSPVPTTASSQIHFDGMQYRQRHRAKGARADAAGS